MRKLKGWIWTPFLFAVLIFGTTSANAGIIVHDIASDIASTNIFADLGSSAEKVNSFLAKQSTVSVSGIARDTRGRGLPRVRVSFVNFNSGIPTAALTNGFGYYQIDGLTAGDKYCVSATHKRFVFLLPTVCPLIERDIVMNFNASFELPTTPPLPPASLNAALTDKFRRSIDPIPGSYIVVLKRDQNSFQTDNTVGPEAVALSRGYGATLGKIFRSAIKGFSANMSEAQAISMSQDSRVAWVEEEGKMFPTQMEQPNPGAALDRHDQRNLPLDGFYRWNRDGSGVHVYIMDTGIRITHNDFWDPLLGQRARIAFPENDVSTVPPCNNLTLGGHGTHVAGLAGGKTYGIAKKVWLHSVKVYQYCESGTAGGHIEAIDWLTVNRINPAVVNMSFAGPPTSALDIAISNSISSGITYVASAGNSNADACNYSPAGIPEVITVAASGFNANVTQDLRASWSNWGSCVDIFASLGGTSAFINHDDDSRFMGGTSMSAPLVTGVVAMLLQQDPSASPAAITQRLIDFATNNVMNPSTLNGSPNRLLYSYVTPATAATVSVSGSVQDTGGRGIHNAVVTITDGNGISRSVAAGSFGNYRHDDIRVGETYVVSVTANGYTFQSRVITVNDEITNLNFVAD